MQTSVPGLCEASLSGAGRIIKARRRLASGFTLIELMVVVVILGIAAAAISVKVFPDRRQLLRDDAQRLAQLFSVAQGEVRADGRPIVWQADQAGYRFARRMRVITPGAAMARGLSKELDTFRADELLRPRAWSDGPVRVETDPPDAPIFTSEWMPAPLVVRLQNADATVVIVRDEAGRYAVQ